MSFFHLLNCMTCIYTKILYYTLYAHYLTLSQFYPFNTKLEICIQKKIGFELVGKTILSGTLYTDLTMSKYGMYAFMQIWSCSDYSSDKVLVIITLSNWFYCIIIHGARSTEQSSCFKWDIHKHVHVIFEIELRFIVNVDNIKWNYSSRVSIICILYYT